MGDVSLRLRVTYGRAVDFIADVDEQVSRGGLLVRVECPDVERGAPVELEVVTPVGRKTIEASVIQTLPGAGVAVQLDASKLSELTAAAKRAPRDPGPAPRFERLKDGPPLEPRTSTGDRAPVGVTASGEERPARTATRDRTQTPSGTRSLTPMVVPRIEMEGRTPPSGSRVSTPIGGVAKLDAVPQSSTPKIAPPPIPPGTRPRFETGGMPPVGRAATRQVATPPPTPPPAPPIRTERAPTNPPASPLTHTPQAGIPKLDRSELGTPREGSQRLSRSSTNPPVAADTRAGSKTEGDSFVTFTPAVNKQMAPTPAPPVDSDVDEPELTYETPADRPEAEVADKQPLALGSETTQSAAQQQAQKIQQALHGDKNQRMAILRDHNKQLHTYVLRNPQLQIDEVLTIAKMSTMSAEMLTAIAGRREWAERPEVALALVRNPKTPIPLAVKMLDHVTDSELRVLAKQPNVRDAVQRAARKKILG